MNQIGFIINNLGQSQAAFCLIESANQFIEKSPLNSVTVFFEEPRRPCTQQLFPIMPAVEGWGFNAPLVAMSLSTAEKAIRFPTSCPKIFYVWDLEWLRGVTPNAHELMKVYRSSDVHLVARSVDHKLAIESCWNRPVVAVIEDFNVEGFVELSRALGLTDESNPLPLHG
jgi:hypothetical protein